VNEQRDKRICSLYQDGDTAKQISKMMGVSITRINQILKRNKIPKHKKVSGHYCSAKLTPELHDAFRAYAKELGHSCAAILSQLVQEELDRKGIKVKPYKDPRAKPLPFEDQNDQKLPQTSNH
jgi:transposase